MSVVDIVFYVFLAVLAVMVTALNYTIYKGIKKEYKNQGNK